MRLVASLLGALSPETAHRVAIRALAAYPSRDRLYADPRLLTEAFGLRFRNPLGLAAGFDKSAEAAGGLFGLGFGFIEIGTLTPKPQVGNPKPRLFRLKQDAAIINRMGFNNDGYRVAEARLKDAKRLGVVGVNIGPNKDAVDRVDDYALGVRTFATLADYISINISSPNTPGLRRFHARGEFAGLLEAVMAARDRGQVRPPVLVKISPDIDDDELEGLLAVALAQSVDGLIVSNTSVHRPNSLVSPAARETGGLSGRPIFSLSTRLVARCFMRCGGSMPIIGVGGVENASTALAKFEAGATLIQIYSGFIYRGPGLINEILRGLTVEMDRRGADSIVPIIGVRAEEIAGK